MKRLEWYIARRYLASRRKGRFLSLITLIAVGGITLGVMALIVVIGVMTGLQRDLQQKILGSNPHVYVFEHGAGGFRLHDWRGVYDSVVATPGVVAAQPFISTQVGLIANNFPTTGMLYGIDPTVAATPMTDVERDLREGKYSLQTSSGRPGMLIGHRLAATLSVAVGDRITAAALETFAIDPLTGNPLPRFREYEVTGIFRTGMFEYDSKNVYTTMPAAQDLSDFGPGTVSGIAVNIADPWAANEMRTTLEGRVGNDYYTDDWMRLNGPLFSALKLEKIAMGVILFLIVLVAAFNIISTLIMVVADKTREIGILKSMGLTDGGVLRIFVLQGITIGVIGTILGTLGGLGLVALLDRYQFIELPGDVYFVDTLPVALNPLDVVLIVLVSLVIAFTATIYPARQASRLLPVEAIRHE